MKKFAILLSCCAIAASALAIDGFHKQMKAGASLSSQTALKTAQRSGNYKISGCDVNTSISPKKVGATRDGEAEETIVGYSIPEGTYAAGMSKNLMAMQGFSVRQLGAFTDVTFKNTTTGYEGEYEWEYMNPVDDPLNEYLFSNEKDLTVQYNFDLVYAPTLIAGDLDFQENPEEVMYSYGMPGSLLIQNQDLGSTSFLYYNKVTNNAFIDPAQMAYSKEDVFQYEDELGNPVYEKMDPVTGLNPETFHNPENNRLYNFSKNAKFYGYANRFDKPNHAFTMSKCWIWANIKINEATKANMTFYKLDSDNFVTDEVLASGEVDITESTDGMLNFDMHAVDEFGFELKEPIVIEDAFIAVLTFENMNSIDYVGMVAPLGATRSMNVVKNAYMVVEDDDQQYFCTCPWYYGAPSYAVSDWCWNIDAEFPFIGDIYLQNEKTVPNEGGNAVFYLTSWDNFNMDQSTELVDWIDWNKITMEPIEELMCYKTTFPVAALPAGIESRSAKIKFSGLACSYELTINQGSNGVNAVVAEEGTCYYDLMGRRVVNPEKGIFIKKAGKKSEKVIL